MQRQGISPEMYYQLTGSTEEDLHKQFEGEAEMRTRTNLVIEAIAAAENLHNRRRNQCRNPRIIRNIQHANRTNQTRVDRRYKLEHDVTMKKQSN